MINKILLVSFFFCISINAQEQNSDRKLMLYSYDNKTWGYVDELMWNNYDEWNVVIPARFEEAGEFIDGLARVKEQGLFGYINKKGEYVIQPIFSEATNFLNNVALVKLPNEWICIDRNGKKVDMPLKDDERPLLTIKIPLKNYTYNVMDNIDRNDPLSKNEGLSLLRIKIK
ncbi:MAG: WG repeat-containing protein [bacterium]